MKSYGPLIWAMIAGILLEISRRSFAFGQKITGS